TTGAASAHNLITAPHDPRYKAAGIKVQHTLNLIAAEDRAWHPGVSGWARCDNPNDTSIGN
ncbi:N-acetylmuramoyl-L-alanine amidase, partial [Pseudomonas aeruginosa]